MSASCILSSRRRILKAAGGIAASAALGGAGLLVTNIARAVGPVSERPYTDFLSAQGSAFALRREAFRIRAWRLATFSSMCCL